MKIVVVGGSGLIGSKLVGRLRERGHVAVPASPASGVDTLTGVGLAEALQGAEVVVDVSNSPSFEAAAVLEFFRTSTRNLLAAEQVAGVKHHVALSVVGAERLPDSGYLRAKVAQEAAIVAGPVPYTILRATQFFEFAAAIANAALHGDVVRLPPACLQPLAASDVAAALTDVTLAPPAQKFLEVAGPERIRIDELARRWLRAKHDARAVVTDPAARYFGALLDDGSLTPSAGARLGSTRFEDWLASA